MINKNEIISIAANLGLPAHTIEKDYVLSWVLTGINQIQELESNWVFKGGTCLKKCFFKNYRFSEDLDFTVLKEEYLDPTFLLSSFEKIVKWIYDTTGIEMPKDALYFESYKNPRGKNSVEGRLYYKGPMKRGGDLARIKLDLSADEIVIYSPERKDVYHPYSDYSPNIMKIFSYTLEEIYAEKLRTLIQRLRPRDIYDVIHIHYNQEWTISRTLVLEALRQKCAFKNVELPTMSGLENKSEYADLKNDWEHMISHQVNNLKPFENYWRRLPSIFNWLYSEND